MTPCITLTTDFGDAGPFVGVMKAVILAHAPDARLHDLTHRIAPCQSAEAGFWLARCFRYFPAGSVHVAVVDPGVGTGRALLAGHAEGHFFLAPDNGILPAATPPGTRLHALSSEWLARQNWPRPSATFHGRDIFAPLAAALLTGRVVPADIGPVCAEPVAAAVPAPRVEAGRITGQVVAIDTWGNLITNIETELLAALPSPKVAVGCRELPVSATYGAAPPGALLALVNSFGVLEIAWREGNAAQLLELGYGAPIVVTG
jgi:S-adenosylmethionine hydrolase